MSICSQTRIAENKCVEKAVVYKIFFYISNEMYCYNKDKITNLSTNAGYKYNE